MSMRRVHRFVVLFGACSIVCLFTGAGSVAHASNNEPLRPKAAKSIQQQVREHNAHADGCRE